MICTLPYVQSPLKLGMLQVLCQACQENLCQDGERGLGLRTECPGTRCHHSPEEHHLAVVQGGLDGKRGKGTVRNSFSCPLFSPLRLSPSTASPYPLQIAPVNLEFGTKTQRGGFPATRISPGTSECSLSLYRREET